MSSKNIPFNFVFDYLVPLNLTVKPMFGLWAIYLNEKIMLILRQRRDNPETNGVWIATSREHHESLKTNLPSLCFLHAKPGSIVESEWQLLPYSAVDFEASVQNVCELIKHGDHRIGRIPKPGKTRTKTTSKHIIIPKN